jgi:hypothetical protein
MTSIADGTVQIQTSSEAVASTPSWFGEVVLIAAHLRQQGVLSQISERVRFARRRFGHYEVIDFLAVLFGYAISGERTLQVFYERLQPFAGPFQETPGWSLILMARVRRLANALCRRQKISPRLIAGWMSSVLLAIGGASADK